MSKRFWSHGPQYAGRELDPASCPDAPEALFQTWFGEAEASGNPMVNAMTLATVDDAGRPAARIVLLKELDERGFVFFTNYESRKGRELDARGTAALLFFWTGPERQVRVEGAVERIEAAASDAYFASRPRASRVGAIASPQSRLLADRAELEARVAAVEAELGGGEPARPPWWGGYRVVPDAIEFWQGQPSRLHDRVLYTRARVDAPWTRVRLAP
jgi:pyridoxamine 5'-phosphate oxidase